MKKLNKSEQVYGYHTVMALIKSAPETIEKIYLLDKRNDARMQQLQAALQKANLYSTTLGRDKLDALTKHANHQGVVAIISRAEQQIQAVDLETLLEECENSGKNSLFLILDGVQDPHNLGACFRTANAAGVTAIIVPKDNAVGLTATVRKVASGAAEVTPFIQVTNLARTIETLKNHNVWIYGTDADAETSIFTANLTGNVAIILGAEGTGLRRLTKELCDQLIGIPMFGDVSSLNVSVATGICLFEVVRQKLFSKKTSEKNK